MFFWRNKLVIDWVVDVEFFDGVQCFIAQFTQLWFALFFVRLVANGTKGFDVWTSLSIWHLAKKIVLELRLYATNIFITFVGTIWKFSGQVNLDCFILNVCNGYPTKGGVGCAWFITLRSAVSLEIFSSCGQFCFGYWVLWWLLGMSLDCWCWHGKVLMNSCGSESRPPREVVINHSYDSC